MRHVSTRSNREQVVFVGLDYATAFVQVCVLDADGRQLTNCRCDNDWRAITTLVARYGLRVRAAIESCTGAADLADELVHRGGWSLDLAHPGYVHRMKQSPDKSDFTDARMLADLVRVGYLPRVWLAPQAVRELRRLVRYRQDLANRRRALKLRISALMRDHRITAAPGRTGSKRWDLWQKELLLPSQTRWVLDEQLAELRFQQARIEMTERRMEQVTKDDPMVIGLLTCRGVGLVTACVIRAEIGDVSRFRTSRQLSRFCGLTPRNASSGMRQADAGLIPAGNRYLRATLMETAHRLMRFDERWQEFTAMMSERGKPRCLIVAAVANRWMRRLYHDLMKLHPAA